MSGENIKKVYVINLDNRRVILLTGLFFLLFSLSFIAGLKWNEGEAPGIVNTAESLNAVSDPETNNPPASRTPGKENNVLVLPEEDTRIFDQQAKHESADPFLADPPGHSKAKNETQRTVERKSTAENADVKPASSNGPEKYYTIQIAAFVHEKDAVSYQGVLKKKDITARVDHGKTHYFVRTGKASDKASLQPLLKKINTTLKLQAIVIQKKTP